MRQLTDLILTSRSVSYGDHERTLSAEYMERINLEFQKIGIRGVSVLFASGDDGAGCHRYILIRALHMYITMMTWVQR